MSGTTYYQRNEPVILNRTKRYYHDNIEVLREKAKNKYKDLSEEEKGIKREYERNRYHNMSEEDKQKLKEYRRHYARLKNQHNFLFVIFFHCMKMRSELVFKIKDNSYTEDRYYFQKNKKPININEADTKKK